ncbi:MAG: hypothetical protein IJ303_00395 [Clostridia bacterium]|nr:hypothetical protein [Clostridia bacterium]
MTRETAHRRHQNGRNSELIGSISLCAETQRSSTSPNELFQEQKSTVLCSGA